MADIDIDEAGIAAMRHEPWVRLLLLERGDAVADTARAIAPVWPFGSRGGAASIHSDIGQDAYGYYVDVSWDITHSYMRYPEAGTKYQRPQKFMERALEIVMGGIQ